MVSWGGTSSNLWGETGLFVDNAACAANHLWLQSQCGTRVLHLQVLFCEYIFVHVAWWCFIRTLCLMNYRLLLRLTTGNSWRDCGINRPNWVWFRTEQSPPMVMEGGGTLVWLKLVCHNRYRGSETPEPEIKRCLFESAAWGATIKALNWRDIWILD